MFSNVLSHPQNAPGIGRALLEGLGRFVCESLQAMCSGEFKGVLSNSGVLG